MANIFDLSRDDFMFALDELGLPPGQRDDLIRQYRRENSIFSTLGLYGLLDRIAQGDEEGGLSRASMAPVSRPEGMTVAEAVMSGDARPAVPQGLLDAANALLGAADAPAAAARGQIPAADMNEEVLNLASVLMGFGGLMSGPRGLIDYDPNALNSGIPWRERLESSIPKDWLQEKFERPQWNPISNVSSVRPESEMMPIHSPTNTLAPERSLRIEDFKDSSAIPALGDRSVAGVEIQGVGDMVYANPTRSLGGADFMRELETGLWANDLKPARELADTANRVLRDDGDPLMVYTAMGPQSGDFSTMMMESVLNDFDPSRIDPSVAQIFDDRIKNVAGIRSWEGLLAPNLRERLADEMTGSQRWRLWQEMDRARYRDAGLPDINLARRSITDPRLLNATPFDSGLTVGRMSGGLLDDPSVTHPTYSTQIAGDYLGGFDNIAGPILWRDFFEGRRNSGAPVSSDQRAFMFNSPRMAQTIDQQMIDEYYQMQEAIRGLNDPSSHLRLWTRNQ